MKEYKVCVVDVDYTIDPKSKKPIIRIFGKTDKKESIVVLDASFEPYFYALLGSKEEYEEVSKKILELKSDEYEIVRVESIEREYLGKKRDFAKVFTKAPGEVPKARDVVKAVSGVEEVLEADILFARRYLLDKGIRPMSMISVKAEPVDMNLDAKIIVELMEDPKEVDEPLPELNTLSFDIEAHNPGGLPQPDRDPVTMLSASSKRFRKVYSYKSIPGMPPFVELVDREAGILENFQNVIKERDVDLLVAYNSDNFDVPYLHKRAETLKVPFGIGRGTGKITFRSRGLFNAAQFKGRVHVDLYHYVTYILRGALQQLNKRTLENVARVFLKEDRKQEVDWEKFADAWDKGNKELKEFFEYSMNDAVITEKLANIFLPRIFEISRLVRIPLFDASRMTYGQLVESYLMWNAVERDQVIPNRPGSEVKEERAGKEAYEGAFVLEPERGMFEDVVLYDFRSLYPTILISHNIDPSTIDCECCRDTAKRYEGVNHWFCKKKRGMIPDVLKDILETRIKTKQEMKKLDEESDEYKALDNKQYSQKILLNSCYGYLGYRGARWYSRECARSITAFGRRYIKKTLDTAKKFGLKPIYSDTDSCYLISEDGKDVVKKSKAYMKAINAELPGNMELEFEGLYKRGIFVSKKRYALIDEKDKLKIKGLEFVRKDWAPIAKETQKAVLETLLKDGDPEKAFKIVRDVVKRITEGDVKLEDLAVYTELTRPLEKYEVTAPHIAAGYKMRKHGKDVRTGTSVGYIIIKGGSKLISDRAEPVDYVKFENYDPKYYIEHQIIPAVSRVMEALGYKEDELLGKKQETLSSFF